MNFLFKIDKGGKFSEECVSNGIIPLKCLFLPTHEVFLAKNQKILKVGKVRKYDEESVFSRKKGFYLLKSLLYQNGKAQNKPVVAGRLVYL